MAAFIDAILGIAILICFFVLCSRVGKIRDYVRLLYVYEKYRMIEDGHFDPKTNHLVKWQFDEAGRPTVREKNDESENLHSD
jgi:hypothetical protein